MTHTKSNLVRWFVIALVTCLTGLALSACNTVEGAGEDIEATGDAIQDAAD